MKLFRLRSIRCCKKVENVRVLEAVEVELLTEVMMVRLSSCTWKISPPKRPNHSTAPKQI
jgi:hypothetical protein